MFISFYIVVLNSTRNVFQSFLVRCIQCVSCPFYLSIHVPCTCYCTIVSILFIHFYTPEEIRSLLCFKLLVCGTFFPAASYPYVPPLRESSYPNVHALRAHLLGGFVPLHVVFNIVHYIYSPMLLMLIQCNSMCYGSIVFTVVNFYWPWLTFFFLEVFVHLANPLLRITYYV